MTREERHIEQDERIDRFLRNQMNDRERAAFEQDVDNDQELRERLVATAMLVKGISQAGMQREGQAQLDAIKQMSQEEFLNSSEMKQGRSPMWSLMKWAASIAAILVIAFSIYKFYPSSKPQQAEQMVVVKEAPIKSSVTKKPAKPTLAKLADEYNKPFAGEPDDFVAIRQQVKKGKRQDMMAIVYDIDKVEWPTAKHGYKGADDEDDIKNTTDNYNDCTHWYKALAYLKAGEKETAIKELNYLIEHGVNESLVERATELLKKLEK